MIYATLIFLCIAVVILSWKLYDLNAKVNTMLENKTMEDYYKKNNTPNKDAPRTHHRPGDPRGSNVRAIRQDIDPWKEN